MDPASIAFGIAGIVPLIAKIIVSAKEYANSVTGARKMIAALIAELEALQSNMGNLRDLLASEHVGTAAGLKFDHTSVLMSCSAACEASLRALAKKLGDESDRRLGRYLLWPLSEKEHQRTLAELRSFTTWVQFALSVDGCRLLSQTSDNVVRVLGKQLEQFQAVQVVGEQTARIGEAVRVLGDGEEARKRREVLDWVYGGKMHAARHGVLQRARAKGSGGWLLGSDEFVGWRDGSEGAGRVLWCSGVQGSGKTILASIVVDELLNTSTGPTSPLAFFYFDHQDHDSQTPLLLACCILRQLLEHLPELPTSVTELYEARSKGSSSPGLQEYESIIHEVIEASQATYIVIDALDECEGGKHLNSVLQIVQRLSHISTCRVLVTSRPYVYDMVPASAGYTQVTVEAHVEDIRRYMLEECDNAGIYDVADQVFVDEMVERLTAGANGMFLLPVLQLRTVLNEPTMGDMQDRLENLSYSLSGAFEDTISRIRRLPESRSRLAMSALMHLAYAKRVLTASELSDVLALAQSGTSLNAKYRPTAKMILQCCQGLAMLDRETNQMRLAHYAIHEYLVTNAETIFPQIGVRLALDCLRYLLLDDFKDGAYVTEEEIASRIAAYPFHAYASRHCGGYARHEEMHPDVWNALYDLYASRPSLAAAIQSMRFAKGYHEGYYNAVECASFTPVHYAAQQGLINSVRMLLERELATANDRTQQGSTPIILAASNGHDAIVRLLLEDHGANPRLSNWYGNALKCAVESGQVKVVRRLVEWGMDPNGEEEGGAGGGEQDAHGRTPLACALDRDSAAVFELLVDLGASLQLDAGRRGEDDSVDVFCAASYSRCERIPALMVRRGWVDVRSGSAQLARMGLLGFFMGLLALLRVKVAAAEMHVAGDAVSTLLWYERYRREQLGADVVPGDDEAESDAMYVTTMLRRLMDSQ